MTDSPVRDRLEFDSKTETYRMEYTEGEDSPSVLVVEGVAAIEGRDPLALEPLYETIDPEALDVLFRSTAHSARSSNGEVSFTYHGYEVAVRSYGIIAIRPLGIAESVTHD